MIREILLGAVLFFAPVVLALIALSRLGSLNNRIWKLEREIESLKETLQRLQESVRSGALSPSPESGKSTARASGLPKVKKSEPVKVKGEEEKAEPVQSDTPVPPPVPPSSPTPPTTGELPARDMEQNITSRWFVWIGAVAIALAGLFLVKYVAERGMLTPAARIVAALGLGAALTVAGEWLRRRTKAGLSPVDGPDYVSMALTASGLFTLYAAVYAAYGLYHLIPALVAFALLAAVSIAAFALSAIQGPFVALMGLVGGLAAPALIPSDSPSAAGLFGYLFVIIIACAAVLKYRRWWWLSWSALGGAVLWVLLWFAQRYLPGDEVVTGLFMAAGLAVFSLLDRPDGKASLLSFLAGREKMQPPGLSAFAWAVAAGLVFLSGLVLSGYATGALITLVAICLVLAAITIVRPQFDLFPAIALATMTAAFALWANHFVLAGFFSFLDLFVSGSIPAGPEIAGFSRFSFWAVLFGAGFFIAGYLAFSRFAAAAVWASVSAAAPVLLLAIAWWGFAGDMPDYQWAMAGVGVSLASLLAATLIARKGVPRDEIAAPLGIYATAVIAAVSLSIVFLLRDAWLTVALCLQLPAIVWISDRLGLARLRHVATVILTIVFVRLALNPLVLDYHGSAYLGRHWIIYGYGVPAAACYAAFHLARRAVTDRLVTLLEGAAVVFTLMLVSGEIRILVAGSLNSAHISLLEAGLQSVTWLAAGWRHLWVWSRHGRRFDWLFGTVLTAAGAVMTAGVSLLLENPVIERVSVGNWPVFNTMLVAYVLPAILLIMIWRIRPRPFDGIAAMAPGAGALVLAFVWVTLETKRAFQGPVMSMRTLSDGEAYTYSAVWLVFAIVLLLAGLARRKQLVRYGGLVVLALTVIKVFLSDMSGLEGLWRVASFLGLGLSLVGIGWLYQRFLGGDDNEAEKTSKERSQV